MKVLGLADQHLVGAGQPVRWTAAQRHRSLLDDDGTVTTLADPARNATYSVQVYAPNPTVAAAGPRPATDSPGTVTDTIRVDNFLIPAWGTAEAAPTLHAGRPRAHAGAATRSGNGSGAAEARTEYEAVANVEATCAASRSTTT